MNMLLAGSTRSCAIELLSAAADVSRHFVGSGNPQADMIRVATNATCSRSGFVMQSWGGNVMPPKAPYQDSLWLHNLPLRYHMHGVVCIVPVRSGVVLVDSRHCSCILISRLNSMFYRPLSRFVQCGFLVQGIRRSSAKSSRALDVSAARLVLQMWWHIEDKVPEDDGP